MPPSAARHARYLCKRISARFTDLPQVICLWGSNDPAEKLTRHIKCDEHQALVTTFADALEQVRRAVQPLIFTQQQNQRGEPTARPTPALDADRIA